VINANLKNVFAIQIRKRNRTQVEVKQRINGWNLERDKNYEKLILMALLPMSMGMSLKNFVYNGSLLHIFTLEA
jgi:hypothetical protein